MKKLIIAQKSALNLLKITAYPPTTKRCMRSTEVERNALR